jgi:Protein kinase domain
MAGSGGKSVVSSPGEAYDDATRILARNFLMKCSSCARELPDGAAFCPACATPVDFSSTPTVTRVDSPAARAVRAGMEEHPDREAGAAASPPRAGSGPRHTPASHTSDFGYEARYVPGTTLLERYRIVAPLGKGGMGEVYRAEDLKLGQTVALKFLPKSLAHNEEALARFTREVRMARQVSHPNVCRVFDIGEADGQAFLTMEFVDGEDMSSLMRRIGRLPADKALEIARQVCAGLAAAHEHGIIHRDLKPANIMLDGRGRARITDFGLAGLATEMKGEDARAGTPAYMSPEQFSGGDVTPKSDLYSLGLVMYEIFTGKKPYEAATYDEMARLREKSAPSAPSAHLKDIDPLVERIILRCLDKDPAKRPASALQVSAALPGGDPVAAALAAGETPSPEMVAASGEKEGLRPAIAWGCLLLIVVGLVATIVLAQKMQLPNLVPLPSPPEVLAARARELAREFGYTATPVDTAYSFTLRTGFLDYIEKNDRSLTRWNKLSSGVPPTVDFWYRESPGFMSNITLGSYGLVDPYNPPNLISGMWRILLDTQGHLLSFEAVPPQVETSAEAAASPPNWGSLFTAAGLDANQFKSVPPQWTPLAVTDARAAWEGMWPGHPELPLRVEAASYRGKPVYFNLISPWTTPDRVHVEQLTSGELIELAIIYTVFFSIVTLGVVMAQSNIRSGRSDRRGATRLALLVFISLAGVYLTAAHHVLGLPELAILFTAVALGLIVGTTVWLLYVALEPHVRRRWPDSLISWGRVLAGQLRDPVVGRDLLLGILAGVFLAAASRVQELLPGWMGKISLPPQSNLDIDSLTGLRDLIGSIPAYVAIDVFLSLLFFFIFFLIRLVLRKEWLAVVVVLLLVSLFAAWGEDHPVLNTIYVLVVLGTALAVLIRFGLFALVVALCANAILRGYLLTTHLSAWYAEPTFFVFFVFLAASIFGFYTSTRGKPLFGGISLDS